MSRSIHATSKDLRRERAFSARDDVRPSPAATELERKLLTKLLLKDNAKWKREAAAADAPALGEFKLKGRKLTKTVKKKRASRPDIPDEATAKA
jgi:hypothetical protein